MAPDWIILTMGLLGGLAIFLIGMDRLVSGFKRIAGNRLRWVLGHLTGNRWTAAATGAGITAFIQSSSVTTVVLVGLVSAEVLHFAQSIAVVFGANVGTTITAQIIAFKVTKYALGVVAAGFGLEFFGRVERVRNIGRAVTGLGLVFFGMSLMGIAIGGYMYIRCRRRFVVKDINPSEIVKAEVARMPKFGGREAMMAGILVCLVAAWIILGEHSGLGGPTLYAVMAMFLALGCAQVVAMETGVYQPPDLSRFLLINGEDADGNGDGTKETHIRHYQAASGDKIFSMTTNDEIWAWSMQTHGHGQVGSGWNYVIRDSDCDGVFDEKYSLDEEFHLPDCLN